MKITLNKPAADVVIRDAHFVRFAFHDGAVSVAPSDKDVGNCLAAEPRRLGGLSMEATGDIQAQIVAALKPNAEQPFYVLRPAGELFRLERVADRPARHIPTMRVWARPDATGPEDATKVAAISPEALWTAYKEAERLVQANATGRPSLDTLAARELVAACKRIAHVMGWVKITHLLRVADAIKGLSQVLEAATMAVRPPRITEHESNLIKAAVWMAEHSDNPLLLSELDRLILAVRMVDQPTLNDMAKEGPDYYWARRAAQEKDLAAADQPVKGD